MKRRSHHQQSISMASVQSSKETEEMQKHIYMLRSQYEREKKLVEEKVRQLTEMQATSVQEKALIKEN